MKENMKGYRFLTNFLGPIYRFWYCPKVIGKENIPSEGPIVVAGNHVHIMDQCNICINTKRNLHYMAKKEYFDDKKVAWFFKMAGCIPVNRSIKDESAKEAAIDVLNNSEALGIFPEGTRNGVKEERSNELYEKYFLEDTIGQEEFYKRIKKNKTSLVNYLEDLKDEKIITLEEFKDNVFDAYGFLTDLILNHRITKDEYYDHVLLPLKFGAVSMAQKTHAQIVPYAITGEYKFRSKNLVVRIGKPFEVGDDLAVANEKLRTEIIRLMKETEKESGK